MKRSLLFVLLIITLLPLFVSCGDGELPPLAEGEIRVRFLDVGEGDCTLIETASATVLVDTGEGDLRLSTKIVSALQGAEIEHIDCLVLTHPHSDHIGGVSAILEAFSVGECLAPRAVDDSDVMANALDALLEHNVRGRVAEGGRSFTYGDLTLEVLSPEADSEYSDINDRGAVLRIAYGEATLLMMADVGREVEAELLDRYPDGALAADILKVGHHGANTSSSYDFLVAASPTYAVISVGSGNSYGHPHEETLRKLQAVGATVFRTDHLGDVVFTGTREGFSPPETE